VSYGITIIYFLILNEKYLVYEFSKYPPLLLLLKSICHIYSPIFNKPCKYK